MDAIILRAKMYRKLLETFQLSPYHCGIKLVEKLHNVWTWQVECDGIIEYYKIEEDDSNVTK